MPGVLPGRVVVLGGGTAGVNAARMATGLAADVTILEVDLERMRFLDITMDNANTLYSSEAHLHELMATTDLLIGAVLVPGAKAPKLITRAMLRKMKPGSVVVDIAIDQGGCAETSRPTTHLDPVYVEEGVTHFAVTNMPGETPMGGLLPPVPYKWTQIQNIKRDPFEQNVGMDQKSLMAIPGALAGPYSAYLYDWNLLPIGQVLWEKELMSYKQFPPLQMAASYNLDQILQSIKEHSTPTD